MRPVDCHFLCFIHHLLIFLIVVAAVPSRPSKLELKLFWRPTRTGQSSGQSQTSDHEEAESHVLSRFRSEIRRCSENRSGTCKVSCSTLWGSEDNSDLYFQQDQDTFFVSRELHCQTCFRRNWDWIDTAESKRQHSIVQWYQIYFFESLTVPDENRYKTPSGLKRHEKTFEAFWSILKP